MRRLCSLLLLLVVFSACRQADKPEPIFELLKKESTGIDFVNSLAPTDSLNILEYLYFYNGGGVAAGDVNNDGWIDLYFVSNQGENKLFLNQGGFRFEDVTTKAGVAGKADWSAGVTMADVNGDGYLDIYVSNVSGYKGLKGHNELFINNQDGTFTESADDYGLAHQGFSTQAAFFDYDRDGDLDMYLLNHSVKSPEVFSPAEARHVADAKGDKLFRNEGGVFIDVTEESGIYSSLIGFGLGLSIADLNQDGWPDIYVSNDFTENDYLYINQQDGTFTEELEQRIQYTSRYAMGNVVADVNNDAFSEIITTDMLPRDPEIWRKSVVEDKKEVYDIKLNYGYGHQYVRNTLQKNLGNGQFSDVSFYANTYASDWSWSPLIFDMDNDGWPDLHITNGIFKRPNDLDYVNYSTVNEETKDMNAKELQRYLINGLPTVKIPNLAMKNRGNFNFISQAEEWGLSQPSYSNGSAYADLNNDGQLDLVVNNTEQASFIYKNVNPKKNAFLSLRLAEKGNNTFALGAKVKVKTKGQVFYRENFNTRGFQSAVPPMLYFGLGDAQKIDEIEIVWPDGKIQILNNVEVNQQLTIEKEAKAPKMKLTVSAAQHFEIIDSPVAYKHEEDAFNDLNASYLMPRKYSTEGPALAIGDVNGDGLDDVFLGGAKKQSAELWIQSLDGSFNKKQNKSFEQLSISEDVAALFFDANGNGHLDLYVTSAGNEYQEGQLFTYDKLYINDGQGNFSFSPMALPQIGSHGKAVVAFDADNDGDQDLFVGANIAHGAYGESPKPYLLINKGNGIFEDQTYQRLPNAKNLGMVNAAAVLDYNNDGHADLVLAGEWMPVTLLENDGMGNFSKAEVKGFEKSEGWWYSLAISDVNGDGRKDIIAGNLGLNTKLKASQDQPVQLYLNDFDNNGQKDPILFHFQAGQATPFATRNDLIAQVSAFKKLHKNYTAYAQLEGAEELFAQVNTEGMVKKEVYEFSSVVFLQQEDGSFEKIALPQEAQYAPIMGILPKDFDGDGIIDLLLVGNLYAFRNDYGKAAAKPITFLKGKGNGQFMSSKDAYLNTRSTWGEYRHLGWLQGNGKPQVVATRNNQSPVWLKLK